MFPPTITRRSFLKAALAAGAAPLILPSRSWAAAVSPNSRIGIGVIGIGKQAMGHVNGLLKSPEVQVRAVCDVDRSRREFGKQAVEIYYAQKAGAGECAAYEDFRELLARPDIDAVVIVTPDHWHAPIALAALAAKKDVYCEKPLTQTVLEAKRLMEATAQHGRVFQTGSQQRSSREFRVACEIVRNGLIGKIFRVEAGFGGPGRPCDLPEEAMEPGLNWDLWLGPAPKRPYNSVLSPRGVHNHFPNWRDYWEYGGGRVTDWGAHHVDIAQWGLGMDDSGPVEMLPPSKVEGAVDGARLRYADGTELLHIKENGVTFFGDAGNVFVNRGKIKVTLGDKVVADYDDRTDKPLQAQLAELEKTILADAKVKLYDNSKVDHRGDWLNCIRSRQQPITNVNIGAHSVISCHLLNFGYRYGQVVKWDPQALTFAGGTGDAKWLTREYREPWKIV